MIMNNTLQKLRETIRRLWLKDVIDKSVYSDLDRSLNIAAGWGCFDEREKKNDKETNDGTLL